MLEERRFNNSLQVPHNLARVIICDKPALKAISSYLELKPLYTSSVIKNAKQRSSEIADYLQISQRTLHTRLGWLQKHKLVWYDAHKDLYLCSLEKLCNKINAIYKSNIKYKRKHDLSNDGLTEYSIRTLAIHESRLKQYEAAKAKVFSKERYDERTFSDMQNGIVPIKAWVSYHEGITEHTYHNKRLRRDKRTRLMYYTPTAPAPINLLFKYEKLYKARMSADEDAEVNPNYTLSCAGLARLFTGNSNASNGYYWEKRLEYLKFLRVKPHHIRLEKTSSFYRCALPYMGKCGGRGYYAKGRGYYDPARGERVSLYCRKSKYGERLIFRTLPNQLFPMLNMHQISAGVQLRLSLN